MKRPRHVAMVVFKVTYIQRKTILDAFWESVCVCGGEVTIYNRYQHVREFTQPLWTFNFQIDWKMNDTVNWYSFVNGSFYHLKAVVAFELESSRGYFSFWKQLITLCYKMPQYHTCLCIPNQNIILYGSQIFGVKWYYLQIWVGKLPPKQKQDWNLFFFFHSDSLFYRESRQAVDRLYYLQSRHEVPCAYKGKMKLKLL